MFCWYCYNILALPKPLYSTYVFIHLDWIRQFNHFECLSRKQIIVLHVRIKSRDTAWRITYSLPRGRTAPYGTNKAFLESDRLDIWVIWHTALWVETARGPKQLVPRRKLRNFILRGGFINDIIQVTAQFSNLNVESRDTYTVLRFGTDK